jgi:hypothetical protein
LSAARWLIGIAAAVAASILLIAPRLPTAVLRTLTPIFHEAF